jgi:hypothetical protein
VVYLFRRRPAEKSDYNGMQLAINSSPRTDKEGGGGGGDGDGEERRGKRIGISPEGWGGIRKEERERERGEERGRGRNWYGKGESWPCGRVKWLMAGFQFSNAIMRCSVPSSVLFLWLCGFFLTPKSNDTGNGFTRTRHSSQWKRKRGRERERKRSAGSREM